MKIMHKSTKLDGPKVVFAPPSNFDPVFGLSCVPRMGTNHDLSEAKNAFRTRRVKNQRGLIPLSVAARLKETDSRRGLTSQFRTWS